jgi:hypothetical protein
MQLLPPVEFLQVTAHVILSVIPRFRCGESESLALMGC